MSVQRYSEQEKADQLAKWARLKEAEAKKPAKPDQLIKESKTSSGERTVRLVKTWEPGGVSCGNWWTGKWVHAVIMSPPSFKGCKHEEVGTKRECENYFDVLVATR